MEYFRDDFQWDPETSSPLKIIIVGAGIAGLAAAIGLRQSGHHVTVLEQSSDICDVGAGIQCAPNFARIMGRLGLLEKVMSKANILRENSLRRWQNNEELGTAPLMPEVGRKYHAPLAVIHRSDLHRILLTSAEAEKIVVHTNCKVVRVDPNFEARIKLASGEWIQGDVIIAADGIKSDIRRQMVAKYGIIDRSKPTGDACYRILIPRDRMKGDQRALDLLNSNVGMRWMGPGGHIMAYPIRNNTVYNMVLIHPQKSRSGNCESWTTKGSKKEMLETYKGWNGLVHDLLSYVPDGDVVEWTLNSHAQLPSWYENKTVLIGDSCHPMLPYVAQGAAQAIEDAAVLTVCFAKTSDVGVALSIYEQVRKARGEAIQNSAATTQKVLHLPDGPEQEERDRRMKGVGRNPDLWADEEWQDYMWGVDVMKDTWYNWEHWKARGRLRSLAPQIFRST